ncbi:MAG: hypothetical protein LC748_04035 [Thermomicrobia bacterium]|nr:hypothetical protein [Thermomicrobia bacterium]
MDMKMLRKRCAARIRDLPIPNPFDMQIFSTLVSERHKRPIVLHPIALHGVVSGAWAAMESIDIVFYEQHATPFHQQHIVLHELSHILCDHQGFAITDEGLRSLLLTDVPIERLRTLQSNHYSDEDEREAEVLASLILERVNNAQADTSISDPNIVGTLQLLDDLEGMTS